MTEEILALSNATIAIDDEGWGLIAPFGEWPKTRVYRDGAVVKEQQFIQVLDNEAADAMLAKENSFFRTLKRALVGIPVYKGHGDLNDVDTAAISNDKQKVKLGVVDRIRKTDRGIEAHFALDNDGAEAVAGGFKFPSAFWFVNAFGQRGDSILARPFKLISVALTPWPNISGVPSLANAKPNQPAASSENQNEKDKQMKQLLIGWLAAKGIVLANEASDQTVLDAVQKHSADQAQSVVALGNERSQRDSKITALENDNKMLVDRCNTQKKRADDSETALSNEQTARKAERLGRATAVVDLAIQKGKLKVADRDTQITTLANSADEAAFVAAEKKLLDGAVIVKLPGASESGKQTAALDNEAAQTRSQYDAAFAKELPLANQDAVKAHNAIMTKPEYSSLAEKLRPKTPAA